MCKHEPGRLLQGKGTADTELTKEKGRARARMTAVAAAATRSPCLNTSLQRVLLLGPTSGTLATAGGVGKLTANGTMTITLGTAAGGTLAMAIAGN